MNTISMWQQSLCALVLRGLACLSALVWIPGSAQAACSDEIRTCGTAVVQILRPGNGTPDMPAVRECAFQESVTNQSNGGNSKNYGPLCAAVMQLQEPAAASTLQWWGDFFGQQEGSAGLMSNEIYSPLYSAHQIGAVLVVLNTSPDATLRERAARWLRATWAGLALAADDTEFGTVYTQIDGPVLEHSNSGIHNHFTAAMAGPRHGGFSGSGPAVAHHSHLHLLIAAALGRQISSTGDYLPPVCESDFGSADCSFNFNAGFILSARALGWSFDPAGRVQNVSAPSAAQVGLQKGDRAHLLRLIDGSWSSNELEDVDAAIAMTGSFRTFPSCSLSIARSSSGVATWTGGDDPASPAPMCNFNTGTHFGVGFFRDSRALRVLAPARSDLTEWQSWRDGGQVCARRGSAAPFCITVPLASGDTLRYRLRWDAKGLRRVEPHPGSGNPGNCTESLRYERSSNTDNMGFPTRILWRDAGAVEWLRIRLVNRGTTVWPVGDPRDLNPGPGIRVGIRGSGEVINTGDFNPFGWSTRTGLPVNLTRPGQPVGCGETAEFQLSMTEFQDHEPGVTELRMGMINNDGNPIAWFPQDNAGGWQQVQVEVPATAAELVVSDPPASMECATSVQRTIVARNVGFASWNVPQLTGQGSSVLAAGIAGSLPNGLAPGAQSTAARVQLTAVPNANGQTGSFYVNASWGLQGGNYRSPTYSVRLECDDQAPPETGGEGESCTADAQCASGLRCLLGTGFAGGTCQIPDATSPAPSFEVRLRDDSMVVPAAGVHLFDVLANDSDQAARPLRVGSLSSGSGPACPPELVRIDAPVGEIAGRYLWVDAARMGATAACEVRYSVLADDDLVPDLQLGVATARLTRSVPVCTTPEIVSAPQSVHVPLGGTASFSVTANCADRYEWYKLSPDGGQLLSGQTATTLSIGPVQPEHAGSYYARACKAALCVATPAAALSIGGSSTQRPYGGGAAPQVVAGQLLQLEAEHFDLGGNGLAYQDADDAPGDDGLGLREPVDVDLEPLAEHRNGIALARLNAGDWVEYTVRSEAARLVSPAIRVRGVSGLLRLELALPGGSWQSFGDVRLFDAAYRELVFPQALILPSGDSVLRLSVVETAATAARLDQLWLRADRTAGSAISVLRSSPLIDHTAAGGASLPMEVFDEGAGGSFDIDVRSLIPECAGAANCVPGLRGNTDVDLRWVQFLNSNQGGYCSERAEAGDWWTYSFDAARSGTVLIRGTFLHNGATNARVATSLSGGPSVISQDTTLLPADFVGGVALKQVLPPLQVVAGRRYVLRYQVLTAGIALADTTFLQAESTGANPDQLSIAFTGENSVVSIPLTHLKLNDDQSQGWRFHDAAVGAGAAHLGLSLDGNALNLRLQGAPTQAQFTYRYNRDNGDGWISNAALVTVQLPRGTVVTSPDTLSLADYNPLRLYALGGVDLILANDVVPGANPTFMDWVLPFLDRVPASPDFQVEVIPGSGGSGVYLAERLQIRVPDPQPAHVRFDYRATLPGSGTVSNASTVLVQLPPHPLQTVDDRFELVAGTFRFLPESLLRANDLILGAQLNSTPSVRLASQSLLVVPSTSPAGWWLSPVGGSPTLSYHLDGIKKSGTLGGGTPFSSARSGSVQLPVLPASTAPQAVADQLLLRFDAPTWIPVAQLLANDTGTGLRVYAARSSSGVSLPVFGDQIRIDGLAASLDRTTIEYDLVDSAGVRSPVPGTVVLINRRLLESAAALRPNL